MMVIAVRILLLSTVILFISYRVQAEVILPDTTNAKAGWYSSMGVVHATDAYYAHMISFNGISNVTTVDRLSLSIFSRTWPGRNVIPLDAKQNRVVIISNDNTTTAIDVVDSKLAVTNSWIVPMPVEVYPGLGDNIVLKPPKRSPKGGVWLLSLKEVSLYQLEGADFNNSFTTKGDYALEYGKSVTALYNNGRKVWEIKNLDISSAVLANDGSAITLEWMLEPGKTETSTEDGIENGKFKFRYIAPDGKAVEISTYSMQGKVMAISPNGTYALVGNQNSIQAVNVRNNTTLWTNTLKENTMISQALMLDTGQSMLWRIDWEQPKGRPKEQIASRLLFNDENGKLLHEYDIWPNLPGKPLPYLSLYQVDKYVDIINAQGVINRFELIVGGGK